MLIKISNKSKKESGLKSTRKPLIDRCRSGFRSPPSDLVQKLYFIGNAEKNVVKNSVCFDLPYIPVRV